MNPITEENGKELVKIARAAVNAAVALGRELEIDAEKIDANLKVTRSSFVTLTNFGQLRGCIGRIFPSRPLYADVAANAYSAAREDGRFTPLNEDEIPTVLVEVSVLTMPQELSYADPEELLEKLRPRVDGVVLKLSDGRSATYLPQVWNHVLDKTEFMKQLSLKTGIGWADAWRQPGCQVLTYQVEIFHEPYR